MLLHFIGIRVGKHVILGEPETEHVEPVCLELSQNVFHPDRNRVACQDILDVRDYGLQDAFQSLAVIAGIDAEAVVPLLL